MGGRKVREDYRAGRFVAERPKWSYRQRPLYPSVPLPGVALIARIPSDASMRSADCRVAAVPGDRIDRAKIVELSKRSRREYGES